MFRPLLPELRLPAADEPVVLQIIAHLEQRLLLRLAVFVRGDGTESRGNLLHPPCQPLDDAPLHQAPAFFAARLPDPFSAVTATGAGASTAGVAAFFPVACIGWPAAFFMRLR